MIINYEGIHKSAHFCEKKIEQYISIIGAASIRKTKKVFNAI